MPTGTVRLLAEIDPEVKLAVTPFPCGQCLNCRINMSMIWSSRIKMERNLWKDSAFLTLTYDDDSVPQIDNCLSLNKNDFTNFLKRFRKYVYPRKIRYFGVGEYGKTTFRPHYHIAIFNFKNGDQNYIQKAWSRKGKSLGFTTIDLLNDKRCNYISGYMVDKLINRGKLDQRVQIPFMRSSKGNKKSICAKFKGGIGAGFAYYTAFQINNTPYITPSDITKMVYGNRNLPIGRYLTNIIAENCGFPEETWKFKNEVYYEELLSSIYGQVATDAEKPNKNPYKKEEKNITYYDSIRARFKQQRLVREKRYKLRQSRNQI